MKRNHYCILNKQYDKESYATMVQRIVLHMRESGEWGRYFPMAISPFPYNHAVANEYYPLSEEVALERGLAWATAEEIPEKTTQGGAVASAQNSSPLCSVSGKPFNITKQERELYARLGIGLPTKSPAMRRLARMAEVKAAMRWYM